MAVSLISTLAALVQVAAAIIVLRLIRETGLAHLKSIIAVAIALIIGGQFLALGGSGFYGAVPAATFTLTASLLLLLGVTLIGPLFRSVARSRDEMSASQRELARSAERLTIVFERAPDAYCLYTPEGVVVDLNKAAEALLRVTREEAIGTSLFDIGVLEPTERQRAVEYLDERKTEKVERTRNAEFSLHRRDGSIIEVDIHTYGVRIHGEKRILAIARDVTERNRTEKELCRSRERLAKAQEVAHMGDWEWDIAADRVTWSDQVVKVFGWKPASRVGSYQDCIDSIHPEDRAAVVDHAMETLQQGSRYDIDHRVVSDTGEVRYVHSQGEVLRDETGQPTRMIGTLIDITTRKKAEEEIRKLNQELEQRVRERTADLELALKELESFSYTVSHDLRQPLHAVEGFLALLYEESSSSLDAESRGYLDRISKTTARMGTMIDDFLQLSRISRATLECEPVDLSGFANDIAEELRASTSGREIDFHIEDGVTATGDAGLLRLLLQNLMHNAWKFTAKRDRARIEFGRESGSNGASVYYVRDDGVGFDMAVGNKIFAAFERAHDRQDFEGNGIGLATVERIVRQHGGRVWAEAAPDRGAVFRFTLPGPCAEPPSAQV